MAKFKVGDHVRVKKFESRPISWNIDGLMDHLMGQVVEIRDISDYGSYVIRDGKYTWYLREREIEPANESVVIYRNGAEVIATDKRSGKTAKAKCAPDDTFDFAVGARLAFDRLMGETKPEKPKEAYYNGKAVCIKTASSYTGFTAGKVYTFIDGETTDDNGTKRPIGYKIRTLDEYAKRSGSMQFIEYQGGAE